MLWACGIVGHKAQVVIRVHAKGTVKDREYQQSLKMGCEPIIWEPHIC